MNGLRGIASAVLLGLVLVQPALAQETNKSVGVRGGINFATLSGNFEFDTRTGFDIGIFGALRFSELWGVQAELSYTQKGGKRSQLVLEEGESVTVDEDFKISYLEFQLPLVLVPKAGIERLIPRIYAGPFVSFELSCDFTLDSPKSGESKGTCEEGFPVLVEFQSLDYGVVFGVGADFSAVGGGLTADVRYAAGLANITDGSDINTQNIQVLLGYVYRF
jgi:hypothetical protein